MPAEFYVSDVDRANRFSRVQDPRKLGVIKQVSTQEYHQICRNISTGSERCDKPQKLVLNLCMFIRTPCMSAQQCCSQACVKYIAVLFTYLQVLNVDTEANYNNRE